MQLVRITATIPFPLRVDPKPYRLELGGTTWVLTVERVEREHPDERLVGPGTANVDLQVDRAGQLAFSKVRAEAMLEEADEGALYGFLDALNLLILQVRDVFDEYWIRTLELDDLYYLDVQGHGETVARYLGGRGGGFTPAVIGRTAEGSARLDAALRGGRQPPVWRYIHLDARDALSLGRYEDCALLAWSALEAGCRQALPGMAYRAGLTPLALAQRLDPQDRTHWGKEPPYSHEDSVRRVSGGLAIVEVAAELTVPQIFDPASVRGSVELAYRLRNIVVHQGARVQRQHAERVWRDVNSLLNSALSLRDVGPPPATLSWRTRFRRLPAEVAQFVVATGMRLVVWRAPREAGFEMEEIGGDVWLRFADDISPRVAGALLLTQWDAHHRLPLPDRAHLQASPPSGIFLEGWIAHEVDAVENAVCMAEALMLRAKTNTAVREMAALSVSRTVRALAAGPLLQIPNPELPAKSAQIAAHLSVLPTRVWARRLGPLRKTQPDAHRLIARWAEKMAGMDPNDPHGRCGVLQLIAANSGWMDTILVVCPVEGVAYGSRVWPRDQAPL